MGSVVKLDASLCQHLVSGQSVIDLSTSVKELVENALDANSTCIQIQFSEYGKVSIVVSDNGDGIPISQISNVVLRSSTSKIKSFEELEQVQSFGFRGEALSALCTLSGSFGLCTRTKEEEMGNSIEYDRNGNIVKQTLAARPIGTTITVTDLFHHLPVRHVDFHKHIKRHYAKCLRILQAYAIISTGVKMQCSNSILVKNKKVTTSVLNTQLNIAMIDNVSNVFGSKFRKSLMEIDFELPHVSKVIGLISKTGHGVGRSDSDRQFFYVNGRPVHLPTFAKGLNESWRTFEMKHKPACMLNFILPMSTVDVNVTPDKRTTFLVHEKELIVAFKEKVEAVWAPSRHTFSVSQSQLSFTVLDKSEGKEHSQGEGVSAASQGASASQGAQSSQGAPSSQYAQSSIEKSSQGVKFISQGAMSSPGAGSIQGVQSSNQRAGSSQGALSSQGVKSTSQGTRFSQSTHFSTQGSSGTQLSNCTTNMDDIEENELEQDLESNDVVEEEHHNRKNSNEIIEVISISSDEESEKEDDDKEEHEECKTPSRKHASFSSSIFKNFSASASSNVVSTRTDRALVNATKTSSPVATTSRLIESNSTTPRNINPRYSLHMESNNEDNSPSDSTNDIHTTSVDRPVVQKRTFEPVVVLEEDPHEDCCSSPHEQRETPSSPSTEVRPSKRPRATTSSSNASLFSPTCMSMETLRTLRSTWLASSPSPSSSDNLSFPKTCSAQLPEGSTEDDPALAASELDRVLNKETFLEMEIVGQFNLGFIITRLHNDLFIIDQHASDEKNTYETLRKTTILHQQPLVFPKALELTAVEEMVLRERTPVFLKNGFTFKFQESVPRVSLLSIPFSKATTFGPEDVHELVSMLLDNPTRAMIRLPKADAMFASRACRSSIMIGTHLQMEEMKTIVTNLATLEQPWNCPHGRPTMRHLVDLKVAQQASF